MKKSTEKAINDTLRLYFYLLLLPIGLLSGGFNAYFFFTQPELFVYGYDDCVGFNCPDPITSDGITVLGFRTSDPFIIPMLSKEEFDERQSFSNRMNYLSFASIGLLLIGMLYNNKE